MDIQYTGYLTQVPTFFPNNYILPHGKIRILERVRFHKLQDFLFYKCCSLELIGCFCW